MYTSVEIKISKRQTSQSSELTDRQGYKLRPGCTQTHGMEHRLARALSKGLVFSILGFVDHMGNIPNTSPVHQEYRVPPQKYTHFNSSWLSSENELYFDTHCLYNYSKRVYTFWGTLSIEGDIPLSSDREKT